MARTGTTGTLVRFFTSVLVLVVIAATVGGLVGGSPAALGVLVGAAVVVAVFSFGMAVTHAVATVSPALSLLVALLTYALQLVVLVLVLTALERSEALGSTLDRGWIGATIIGGTLVWSVALVRLDVLYHRSATRGEAAPRPPSEGPERP